MSSGHANRRVIDASSRWSSTGNGTRKTFRLNTFDDLGDKFVKAVLASGKDFD